MRRWRKRQTQLALSASEQLPLVTTPAPKVELERGRIRKSGGWVKLADGRRGYLVSIEGEKGLVRFAGRDGWPFPREVELPLQVLSPARARIAKDDAPEAG